jgi:hypothetical protein
MGADPERASRDRSAMSWGGAILGAAAMVLLSFLVFVLIPNSLLGYLTTRMTPTGRDLVIVGWWALAFLIASLVFVSLQHRGKA